MWPFTEEHNCLSNVVIPDMVRCEKCMHLILRSDAQIAERRDWGRDSIRLYFCPQHRVKWERVRNLEEIVNGHSTGHWKDFYFMDNVACDESGKILTNNKGGK